MLNLTPQIQNSLGDAILLLEGDVLYAVAHDWMLVILHPERWLTAEALAWLADFGASGSRHVDWKILTAREIDLEGGKYLPEHHHKFEDIFKDSWSDYRYINLHSIRANIEAHIGPTVYANDLVDLSALFANGQARAMYPKSSGEWASSMAKKDNAEMYVFRYDDKVVPIDGGYLRGFTEMGMTLSSPREAYSSDRPAIGLRLGDDAVGFMSAAVASGITSDRHGRDLHADAATLCWPSVEELEAHLGNFKNFPLNQAPLSTVMQAWDSGPLRLTVGSLRWQGWSDEDILATYDRYREPAWWVWHRDMQEQLGQTMQELSSDVLNSWRLSNIETRLQRMCEIYEVLQPALGCDLGDLPEAVAMLDVLQSEPEHLSMEAG